MFIVSKALPSVERSSSYSSAALDFENLHKLDPVFDSPRMSRRSLRLTTPTTVFSEDLHNSSINSNVSYSGSASNDRTINRQVVRHNIVRGNPRSGLEFFLFIFCRNLL
ncbi:unnamed protein product [Ranitomeya imitator]|uniref:Uncharacterized protein n=1 Tax=Ranitomeya imitator TaxID=111125 RepID=A0ABN9L291_9NEOB|nr:unnamed protein product [Ranitomeya imitator]